MFMATKCTSGHFVRNVMMRRRLRLGHMPSALLRCHVCRLVFVLSHAERLAAPQRVLGCCRYKEELISRFKVASFRLPSLHVVSAEKRMYKLEHNALEVFCRDSTSYFFAFEDRRTRKKVLKELRKVCRSVVVWWTRWCMEWCVRVCVCVYVCVVSCCEHTVVSALTLPHMQTCANLVKQPSQQEQLKRLMDRWVNREVTNFEYLMRLNRIAGRSYNDISQYPVRCPPPTSAQHACVLPWSCFARSRTFVVISQIFPWVLKDYTSENIDLKDPSVYRDLRHPIKAQTREQQDRLADKYQVARANRQTLIAEGADEHMLMFAGPPPYVATHPSNIVSPDTCEHVEVVAHVLIAAVCTLCCVVWDTRYHYGTFYLNPGTVIWYLQRMEPFTSQHIILSVCTGRACPACCLGLFGVMFVMLGVLLVSSTPMPALPCSAGQDGKFDHPNRQFHSIAAAWDGVMRNDADIKELIPEFFYNAEFLKNLNGINLGTKGDQHRRYVVVGGRTCVSCHVAVATGVSLVLTLWVSVCQSFRETIGDVALPPWARGSAERFVRINREALNSSIVSARLHAWVDLIFGCVLCALRACASPTPLPYNDPRDTQIQATRSCFARWLVNRCRCVRGLAIVCLSVHARVF